MAREVEKSRQHKECINASKRGRRRQRRIRKRGVARRDRSARRRKILEPYVLCTVAPITMVAMLSQFLKAEWRFKAFHLESFSRTLYQSVKFNRGQRECTARAGDAGWRKGEGRGGGVRSRPIYRSMYFSSRVAV